jgi:ParB-like chromosome segregation protein Spo0J
VTVFLLWQTVPGVVRPDLTDHQARLLNVTENLERKDLNIWEEARALERLYPKGVTLRQAAKELKQTTHWVHVRLRLLRMPEGVQRKAAAGLLSQANLDALAGLDKPEDQVLAAGKIAEARQAGRGKRLPGVDRRYKRRTSKVRSKEEINHMVERMLSAGIDGLAPRVGAWCAGNISDDDLLKDIETAPKVADAR